MDLPEVLDQCFSLLGNFVNVSLLSTILCNQNNMKRDLLDIQHPKFENSRLGLIESVNER